MRLFSRIDLARTHRAHCDPEGSFAPGGKVWKYGCPPVGTDRSGRMAEASRARGGAGRAPVGAGRAGPARAGPRATGPTGAHPVMATASIAHVVIALPRHWSTELHEFPMTCCLLPRAYGGKAIRPIGW